MTKELCYDSHMTKLLFWSLCLAVFIQDLFTRTFSRWWLLPAAILLAIVPWQADSSLLFCALVLLLWRLRPDWIGSADVTALFVLSLIAGQSLYRLVVAACGFGLLYSLVRPQNTIPFVSCLAAGTVVLAVLN